LATQLEEAYRNGDNSAAKEHPKAGNPIYYIEEDMPKGLLIKEYSDRRRELIRISDNEDVPVEDLIPGSWV